MKLRKQLRPFTLLDVNGLGDTNLDIPWWENEYWFIETLGIIESKGFKLMEEIYESATQKTHE